MLYSPCNLVEQFFKERQDQAFEQLDGHIAGAYRNNWFFLISMLFLILLLFFPFHLSKSYSSFNIKLKSIFFRKLSSFAEASLFPTSLIVYNLICILDRLCNCFIFLKVCVFFEGRGLCIHLCICDLTEAA